jgi:GPH family glycoside/pentoside/hexuronide:cation symporter
MMMSFFPAAFAFIAVVVMSFYKLDNNQMTQIQAGLAKRKANAENAAIPLAT